MKKHIKLPKLIAHRGAKSHAPENTLSAFKLAKTKGATWVEFDVQMSADEQLFLLHDDDLRRTTNGKGLARDFILAELKSLDAGSWFSSQFMNEKLPTLEEAVDCLKKIGLSANLEVKACGDPEYDIKLAQQTCDFLKRLPVDFPVEILVSSFSFEVLETIREKLPDWPLAMLLDVTKWNHFLKHLPEIRKLYQRLDCCSLNINQDILTKDRLRDLDFAEQIACYTVNKPERAKALFAWGVDCLFSDQADLSV